MSFDLVRDFAHVKLALVLCYETDLCHLLRCLAMAIWYSKVCTLKYM